MTTTKKLDAIAIFAKRAADGDHSSRVLLGILQRRKAGITRQLSTEEIMDRYDATTGTWTR